jgi:hypothetical protein
MVKVVLLTSFLCTLYQGLEPRFDIREDRRGQGEVGRQNSLTDLLIDKANVLSDLDEIFSALLVLQSRVHGD